MCGVGQDLTLIVQQMCGRLRGNFGLKGGRIAVKHARDASN